MPENVILYGSLVGFDLHASLYWLQTDPHPEEIPPDRQSETLFLTFLSCTAANILFGIFLVLESNVKHIAKQHANRTRE